MHAVRTILIHIMAMDGWSHGDAKTTKAKGCIFDLFTIYAYLVSFITILSHLIASSHALEKQDIHSETSLY